MSGKATATPFHSTGKPHSLSMSSSIPHVPPPSAYPLKLTLTNAQSLPQPSLTLNRTIGGPSTTRDGVSRSLFASFFKRMPRAESTPIEDQDEKDRATAPQGLTSQLTNIQRLKGRPRVSMPGNRVDGEGRSSNNSGSLNEPSSPTASRSNRIVPLPSSANITNLQSAPSFARRSKSDTPFMQGGGVMVRPPPSPLGRQGQEVASRQPH